MSLIAKIQQQSLLQTKLQSQLAEMSYQDVNGTRQVPRNFREGTLEIGKMHFTAPQDRITKEMMMDYQKTEQEKRTNRTDEATGKAFLYEPTGLGEALDVYKDIVNGPITGRKTTESDLSTYKDAYLQLHYDLEKLKVDAKGKNVEVSDKQVEIIKKGKEVQVKQDEHTEAQKYCHALNAELTDVKRTLAKIATVIAAATAAASSGTPTKPITGATDRCRARLRRTAFASQNIAKGKTKEKELEDDMVVVEADMLSLQAEIVTLQTEKLKLDADLAIPEGQYTVILGDIKKTETAISAKETEVRQIKQNIIENKEEIQKVNNKNNDITRKYTETFNMANRDRYSVQQDPNEDDQEYIDRIKKIETNTFDPNIYKEKSTNEGNLKLMTNLRKSLRDEVKISEIVKKINTEEVFIMNTNWYAIQEQLEIKFGINNPIKTVNDYVTEIRDIIDKLQNKQYGTTLAPTSTAASTTLGSATAPMGGARTLKHTSDNTREKKNSWLLGKMFESGFPDASGREEG
jgi:hypothetical protein